MPMLPLVPLAPQPDFAEARVLVVDDDASYRFLLRSIAQRLGVGVVLEAENGREALALANSTEPQLILLDVMMPELDGISTCRMLREDSKLAETAILIQTGLKTEQERVACFAAGASDVISKPLSLPELQARMVAHLRAALYSRALGKFRTRVKTHLELAAGLISSIMPNPDECGAALAHAGYELTVYQRAYEEVGGDLWYAAKRADGSVLVLLIDACAHGVIGAMTALRVDSLLRELEWTSHSITNLAHLLDQKMASLPGGNVFAGMTALELAPDGSGSAVVTGNPPLLLSRHGPSQIEKISSGGMPLGSGMVAANAVPLQLSSSEMLVMHSDGWPDPSQESQAILATLQGGNMDAHQLGALNQQPHDDCTILTIKRNPRRD